MSVVDLTDEMAKIKKHFTWSTNLRADATMRERSQGGGNSPFPPVAQQSHDNIGKHSAGG
jgi:hypothetical protein